MRAADLFAKHVSRADRVRPLPEGIPRGRSHGPRLTGRTSLLSGSRRSSCSGGTDRRSIGNASAATGVPDHRLWVRYPGPGAC
jgi:hypothetical protein